MTRGLLSSMAALLAGTGLALAQAPAPMPAGPATAAAPSGAQPSAPMVIAAVPDGGSPYVPGGPVPVFPNTMTGGGPGELMTVGGGCGPGGCGLEGCPHGDCSDPCHRLWFDGDYILWRIGGSPVPSQLTFNQPLGVITVPQITSNGAGQTITINQNLPVLMAVNAGTSVVNFKDLPGMRFSGGLWFDDQQCWGVDASFFWLWRRTQTFSNIPIPSPTGTPNTLLIPTGLTDQIGVPGAGSNPASIISIPINITANVQSNVLGTISSQLWGTEFDVRSRSCYFGCATIDCIAGFRYLDLNETLQSNESLALNGVQSAQGTITIANAGGTTTTIPPPPIGNITFSGLIEDRIHTDNQFYGAQVGFVYDVCLGKGVFLSGYLKAALGDQHETLEMAGFTVASGTTTNTTTGVTTSAGPTVLAGGALVGPAQNGLHQSWDRICFLPDGSINIGYQPCHWLRAYVGYDVMFISTLARPGDTVGFTSTAATVTIGGSAATTAISAPTLLLHDTATWVQGINFGVELRW
jgi:Putative beta barrel porin-7 (BBP7)